MEQPEGVWWPFGTRKAFVGPHGRTGGFCLVAGNSAQKTPNPIPTHPLGRPNKPQTPYPPTHLGRNFRVTGKWVGGKKRKAAYRMWMQSKPSSLWWPLRLSKNAKSAKKQRKSSNQARVNGSQRQGQGRAPKPCLKKRKNIFWGVGGGILAGFYPRFH